MRVWTGTIPLTEKGKMITKSWIERDTQYKLHQLTKSKIKQAWHFKNNTGKMDVLKCNGHFHSLAACHSMLCKAKCADV